uniref:Neurobeachin n=1 Tax=Trichobilharzia regenti TaxID=157069 RepID=A0AA85KF16_TRIRE|nr:unnamed protein product [Trichobilharzia regenti]
MGDSTDSITQIIEAFRIHSLKINSGSTNIASSQRCSDITHTPENKVIYFIHRVAEFVRLCAVAKPLEVHALSKLLQEIVSPYLTSNVVSSLLSRIYQSTDCWPSFSAGFLEILHLLPYTASPHAYFNFPESESSNIALPPTDKWPCQSGWTFHCWLYRYPSAKANNKINLYCFQTCDRLGFSGYFVNDVFFLSLARNKGKIDEFPVNFNFHPHEWFMITIVHSFARWSGSNISCYVNGVLVSNFDVTWHLNSSEIFKTCLIGQSSDPTDGSSCFSGHISIIMGFMDVLTSEQISYIYLLGPKYQGQFRFETESCDELISNQSKITIDLNKLHNSLVFAYSPLASDGRLCLNQAVNFHQSSQTSLHAIMNGNVSTVISLTVPDLLIRLGGIQLLYPLFNRLDWSIEKFNCLDNETDLSKILSLHPSFANLQPSTPEIQTILVRLIFSLVRTSITLRNQFISTKGLLIIANALNQSEAKHLTMSLLDEIIQFTRYLLKRISSTQNNITVDEGDNHSQNHNNNNTLNIHNNLIMNSNVHIILLKQMYGYLISNSELWCRATVDVQEQLYQFLATDFMEAVISGYIGRTGTVIHCLNTLKYYLALASPRARSGYELNTPDHELLGSVDEVVKLRTNVLIYLKRLFSRGSGITDSEMQAILNFLTTIHEPENIHDILYLLVSALIEYPSTCGAVFIRTNGIHCVFKLLTSEDEHVRIYSIKLFGLYLLYGKNLVYGNTVERFSLFSLLEDRLNSVSSQFTLLTYNALFEVLTESISPKIRVHPIIISEKSISMIKNPALLKVIAQLISQSEQTSDILSIKDTFIQHLFAFCAQNPSNKKIILQLSIWQDWLLRLAPLYPNNKMNAKFLVKILRLIRVLLIHGICYEYGSWQVFVDTLALIHLHICEERFSYFKEKQQSVKSKNPDFEKKSNLAQKSSSVLFANKDSIARNNSVGVDLTDYASHQMTTAYVSPTDSPSEHPLNTGNSSNSNDDNSNKDTQPVHDSDANLNRTLSDSTLSYENIEISSLPVSKSPVEQRSSSPLPIPSPPQPSTSSPHTAATNADHDVNIAESKTVTNVMMNEKSKRSKKSVKFQLANFSWSYVHHLLLDDLLCSLENIVVQQNIQRRVSLHSTPTELYDNVLKHKQTTKKRKESLLSSTLPAQLKSTTKSPSPTASTSTLSSVSSTSSVSSNQHISSKQVSTISKQSNNDGGDDNNNSDSASITENLPHNSNNNKNNINHSNSNKVNDGNRMNANNIMIIDMKSESAFVTNLLQIISYLCDMIIGACGGLLPLLAAASSSTSEIGSLESVRGMELSDAIGYLLRLTYLADFCIMNGNYNLKLLESERNLTPGSIVRQLLRLYLTTAVRNCLESRLNVLLPSAYLVQTMKQLASGSDIISHTVCNDAVDDGVEVNEVLFIQLAGDGSHNIQSIQIISGSTQTSNGDLRVDKIKHDNNSNGIDITSKEFHSKHLSLPMPNNSSSQNNNLLEDSLENLTRKVLNLSRFHLVVDLEYYTIHRLGCAVQPWKFPDYLASPLDLFRIGDMKQAYDTKIRHLSGTFQQLLYGIKPYFNYPKNYGNELFQNTVISPIKDFQVLMQNSDLLRIHYLINRYGETSKSPESLALATVYFLSVMMVSKYRDFLDSNPIWLPYSGDSGQLGRAHSNSNVNYPNGVKRESCRQADTTGHTDTNNTINNATSEGVVSLSGNDADCSSIVSEEYELVDIPLDEMTQQNKRLTSLTDSLDICLGSTGIVLKALFSEFTDYFTRTLIGTHGQELFPSVQPFLQDNSSVIELVMLLCSQEWQTSLQKYGGLGFIELVNEGRLISHSIRDHLYRVAAEGDILLNQLHVSNIQQHTKFEEITAHIMADCREEEQSYTSIIESTRLRDVQLANYLNNKVNRLTLFILSTWCKSNHHSTVSSSSLPSTSSTLPSIHPLKKDYYRLDGWEDDSRRHRRLIPNPHGTSYSSAVFYNENIRRRSVVAIQNQSDQLANLFKEAGAQHARDFSVSDESATEVNSVSTEMPPDNTSVCSTVNESVDTTTETLGPITLTWFQEDMLYPGRLCIDFKDNANLSVSCILVSLGVTIHGTLSVSRHELYFEQDAANPLNELIDQRVLAYIEHVYSRWSLSEIRAIFNRSFLHRKVALEIFVASRGSVLFAFKDVATMKSIVNALPEVGIGTRYGLPASRSSTLAPPSKIFQLSNMTQRWQRRELSNFDYLMYLNTIAGRSYNDLNQYPIFPWVISNYDASELDLSSPSNYRDLSKPIGAINPKRKAFFDERYNNWEDESRPPFHYGTHYSTAAFVLNYLLRVEPFTTVFLNLQGGKFDHPDRIFFSIAKTWENCQINTSDVKELIPEFFYFPEMFENLNDLDLGITDDGIHVDTVILPPWAKTPEEFVRINREALESELVSCQLHHWIDLIFGYKQRGPEAVRATNVFHYLTYDGSVDWDKITDPLLIKAVEDQIQSFGQTPGQLLTTPHPRRNSTLHHNPEIFNLLNEEFCMSLKFHSHSPIVKLFSNTSMKATPFPSVIAVSENRTIVVCRWNALAADAVYRKARVNHDTESIDTTANNHDTKHQQTKTPSTTSNNSNNNNNNNNDLSVTSSSTSSLQPIIDATVSPMVTTSVTNFPTSSKENARVKHGTEQIVNLPLKSEFVTPLGRCLGNDFDENMQITSNQFVVTADSRAVIQCGYYDRSFRIYGSRSNRLIQAVFGHSDIVTCLARSECHFSQYYYLASGSRDCTVMLWMFSMQRLCVVTSQGKSYV